MRKAVLLAFAALLGTGFGQGVVERLEGDFSVVASATNERGSVFVELDAVPTNVGDALRAGVAEEPAQAIAIVTPDDTVQYAVVINGTPFVYSTSWIRFVQLNHPAFRTHDLEIVGDEGKYLSEVALVLARQGTAPRSTSAAASPPATPPAVQQGGVLDRLQGEFNVIARATNEAGTVFVEVDRLVGNLEAAIQGGLREEDFQRIAIFTPDGVVHYGERYGNRTFAYSRPWVDFVKYPVPLFSMDALTHDSDSDGDFLSEEAIEMARASSYTRPPPPAAVGRGGRASSGGQVRCESRTTSSTSTMTCYSGGRVTYQLTCTVNPVTYEVNCRSNSY